MLCSSKTLPAALPSGGICGVMWVRTPPIAILSTDRPTHETPHSSANRAAQGGYVANNTNYCYMLATRYTGSNGIQGDEMKAI